MNLPGPNGQQGWLGRGVTVAVIDGGIDARFATNDPRDGFSYVHPEFLGRLDPRSRRIFANGNWDLQVQDTPGSHGVHVAGTIAAAADGVGMMGIAPMANILALRAIGPNAGDPTQSMAFAGSLPDVRVINGSYGPSATAGEQTWNTGSLDQEFFAVRQALANGKVLVFATGNDFRTAPIQAQNPTGIPLFPFINPRNAEHGAYNDGGRNYDFSILNRLPGFIVAVANLDHNLVISADSNRCGVAAAWCVSAPGGGVNGGTNRGILSTVVRGVERVEDSPSADPVLAVGPDAARGYAYLNGTSMATPHVSGVIAVLMEAYPTYSARDIVRLLFATADDLGARGVDRIYGHGLVRLDRALLAAPNIAAIPGDFVPSLVPGEPTVWAAPIATDRGLVVQGSRGAQRPAPDGDLEIAGIAEFRGGVDVSTGELLVNGTLIAPRLHVAVTPGCSAMARSRATSPSTASSSRARGQGRWSSSAMSPSIRGRRSTSRWTDTATKVVRALSAGSSSPEPAMSFPPAVRRSPPSGGSSRVRTTPSPRRLATGSRWFRPSRERRSAAASRGSRPRSMTRARPASRRIRASRSSISPRASRSPSIPDPSPTSGRSGCSSIAVRPQSGRRSTGWRPGELGYRRQGR